MRTIMIVPGMQFEQVDAPAAENVPAGHPQHKVLPLKEENIPFTQGTQPVGPDRPVFTKQLPEGHI